jgi:hypothetical protein
MFRATAGTLAQKLQDASAASRDAAAQAHLEAARITALQRENELLNMKVEDLTCHSRRLADQLGEYEASRAQQEAQWRVEHEAEQAQSKIERDAERAEAEKKEETLRSEIQAVKALAVEQQAMLCSEIEALLPLKVEVPKLRQQEAALCAQLVSVLSPVSVMCRMRPMKSFSDASSRSAITTEGGEITVEEARGRQRKFRVDRVLDDTATHADVFTAAAPWVEKVALGGSSCVFGYGATGAGKTHTLLGDGCNSSLGLAHQAIRRLIEGKHGGEVQISMVEVYCDKVRDLLGDTSPANFPGEAAAGPPILQCSRRDAQGRMVLDCVQLPASTFARADVVLRSGYKNRATEGTRCNEQSSRSHVVLTVRTAELGRLVLVDLAGSENVQRSGADEGGKLLAEAKAINKSLSALADVVEAIAKQQTFVPYRNTRLTMLLEETLCLSKVLFLVHVSPLVANATDSGYSLQFASRIQTIDFGAQRMQQDQEDRLKAAMLRSQQELEKVKKERDDSIKACQDAKQQAAQREQQRRQTPPPRRSDEEETQRLRRELAEVKEQLKLAKAGQQDDRHPAPSPRPVPRVRTPTPPVRLRPSTISPCVTLAASATQSGIPPPNLFPMASSNQPNNQSRTPLGDVTNSALDTSQDLIKANTKAELQAHIPASPAKCLEKMDVLVSPASFRSPPRTEQQVGDAADMAAGGPSPSPVLRHSPCALRSPVSVPALQVYDGFSVRSILKASPSRRQPRFGPDVRCRFAEEVPVPHSPPKWYLDHLDALRNPTLSALDLVDVAATRAPRQFTPPPRKRVGSTAMSKPDASGVSRWRN